MLFAATVGGLAGWAFLAALERLTARAARIWTATALAALLLSLGGPLSGTGVSTGNRIGLLALHLMVGAVLIVALPGRRSRAQASASRWRTITASRRRVRS